MVLPPHGPEPCASANSATSAKLFCIVPASVYLLYQINPMRKMGLEPTRPCGHKILSLARLPVPTLPHAFHNASNILLSYHEKVNTFFNFFLFFTNFFYLLYSQSFLKRLPPGRISGQSSSQWQWSVCP